MAASVRSPPINSQSVEPGNLALSAPQISTPKGGGAIRGIGEKFAANPVTGTGSLTIPIPVTPGRAGFEPKLELAYDFGAGNGPFGLGWHLALPTISRKTDKGLPTYREAEDIFILSGREDLVALCGGDGQGRWSPQPGLLRDGHRVTLYRPRVEGLFARIERWTRLSDGDTHWRSISRDNVTTMYGRDDNSRIADPDNPSHVFSWLICESFDDKGNAIVYRYAKENSASLDKLGPCEANRSPASRSCGRCLKRIFYGNRTANRDPDTWAAHSATTLPASEWMFEVVFDYGEGHYQAQKDDDGRAFAWAIPHAEDGKWPARLDPFSNCRAGFEVRSYRLCRRILMFHHFQELESPDYLVRSTEFTFHENPIATYLRSATQSGYRWRSGDTFFKRSLPTLDFEYSSADPRTGLEVRHIDTDDLANLPTGIEGLNYQFVDLDGEGAAGILVENAGDWYYQRNLSPLSFRNSGTHPEISARFEAVAELASLPSMAGSGTPRHQFVDLAGDGQLDCLVLERPHAGFFERTADYSWEPFTPLPSAPNLDWRDPNLRFIDLTGDGHSDLLITENDVFTWHPSLAEAGFGAAIRVNKPRDEDDGPAIVFADINQSIFLADMSGDGLTDIVRIRDREVCYWPNLGYGRFGRKITMDRSPRFGAGDLFDPQRIRLADIDGSGVNDIIYLDRSGVKLFFNQSGNGWSEPVVLSAPFPSANPEQVQVHDLLGSGTACLVWLSPAANDGPRGLHYIDLMDGQKPHLLVGIVNNLGAETKIRYAPSTKFYLADRRAGSPWITRLPFPMHVVERVEIYDRVSRSRFGTHYAYHHGYFDPIENAVHGFGMVEQWDTEEFATLAADGTLSEAENIESASHIPPIHTKTWFHTGAYLGATQVSKQFEPEYYRESDPGNAGNGLSDRELAAMRLPDTLLPNELLAENGARTPWPLRVDEARQACRALKGQILRQEVFGKDGDETKVGPAARPYSVSERNYTVELLQPSVGTRDAVLFVHPRETIDFHHERKLYAVGQGERADPRVSHELTLKVDAYGNICQSVAIAYGRRFASSDGDLEGRDRAKQSKALITYVESDYTNAVIEPDDYRVSLPAETRTYEIVNVAPKLDVVTALLAFDDVVRELAKTADSQHSSPTRIMRLPPRQRASRAEG